MLWIFFVKPPHLNGIYQTKACLKELATQRLLACKCTTSGLRIRIQFDHKLGSYLYERA